MTIEDSERYNRTVDTKIEVYKIEFFAIKLFFANTDDYDGDRNYYNYNAAGMSIEVKR